MKKILIFIFLLTASSSYLKAIFESAPSLITKSFTTSLGDEGYFWEVSGLPKDDSKPVIFLIGGLRGDEPYSGDAIESFLVKLNQDYMNGDEEVVKLLERVTFRAVPELNPSGLRIAAGIPGMFPWNGVPWDDDGDGFQDEDPPVDLNGDGVIGSVRIKKPWGEWKEASPKDDLKITKMKKANFLKGEKGGWILRNVEGNDSDGDGLYGEDGLGGISLDRNFPYNWQFHYSHKGGGPFSVSENEVKFIVDELLASPEVAFIVNVRDIGAGMAYPMRDESLDKTPQEDKKIFEAIGERFKKKTPYESFFMAKDGPDTWSKKGNFLDWAYAGLGRWAVSVGMWGLLDEDEETGKISFEKAWHQVSEKEWFETVGYKDWSSYKEGEDSAGWPVYGRTRIPENESRLDGVLDSWIKSLVEELPILNVAVEESERISSETVKIKFRVWNSGLLSTDSAMSERIRESSNIWVKFPEGDMELVLGLPEINLGTLSPGESKSWEWVIKGRKKIDISPIHPRSFINSLTIYLQEIK
tara:strand:- start:6878 stop:8458 length:1581 start_codon:yes stop_codon:yes gene_type:complete